MAAARRGDPDAFAAFYERRFDLVMAYLRRRTASAELAADLCAETFTAVLVALHERQLEPANAVAFTLTVAQNKLNDSYRRGRVEAHARQHARLAPLDLRDEDMERIDALTDEGRITELLSRLPASQREAVRQHIVEDRTYDELATSLQTSEMVVRKRVSRGLTTLRSHLENS